jgi:hypothetical protein
MSHWRDPLITVVIPTIKERAHWLAKCQAGYHMTTGAIRVEQIVIEDRETCAIAWNEGIEQARAPYIHLTADDIVPHKGWYQAALAATEAGFAPAPLILNSDGTVQSCGNGANRQRDGALAEISRIPWGTRDLFQQIGPFPEDMHYYTDNWFSWAARRAGVETRVKQDYLFTHHLAPERREMADQRLHSDGEKFTRRTRRG